MKLSNFFNFFLKSLLIARARKSDFSPNQGFLRLSIAQFHKSSLLLKSVCLSTSPFVNIFSRPIFFAAHEWVGFQNGRWRRRRRRMTNSCRLMSEVFFCNLHKFYARTINFHVEWNDALIANVIWRRRIVEHNQNLCIPEQAAKSPTVKLVLYAILYAACRKMPKVTFQIYPWEGFFLPTVDLRIVP